MPFPIRTKQVWSHTLKWCSQSSTHTQISNRNRTLIFVFCCRLPLDQCSNCNFATTAVSIEFIKLYSLCDLYLIILRYGTAWIGTVCSVRTTSFMNTGLNWENFNFWTTTIFVQKLLFRISYATVVWYTPPDYRERECMFFWTWGARRTIYTSKYCIYRVRYTVYIR